MVLISYSDPSRKSNNDIKHTTTRQTASQPASQPDTNPRLKRVWKSHMTTFMVASSVCSQSTVITGFPGLYLGLQPGGYAVLPRGRLQLVFITSKEGKYTNKCLFRPSPISGLYKSCWPYHLSTTIEVQFHSTLVGFRVARQLNMTRWINTVKYGKEDPL